MSIEETAELQAGVDWELQRLRKNGFLKGVPKAARARSVADKVEKATPKVVVVEKKNSRPKLTMEQITAAKAKRVQKPKEQETIERQAAIEAKRRQQMAAEQTIRDVNVPVGQRIAAAETLGYQIFFRWEPEGTVKKVVFRHPNDRIRPRRVSISAPKGKRACNARHEMETCASRSMF